jgi:hypothetical protein
MVAAGPPRMEVGRLEHCAHLQRRPVEVRVAAVEDERTAAARRREPEQHTERGRLASAVGAEKPP